MKRVWAVFALVVLAVLLGLAAGEADADPLTPAVENHGPRGLAVLAAFLEERQRVIVGAAPLTALPAQVASIIIAAPTIGELSGDEVEAIHSFAQAGGTIVYLAAREGPAQPALHRWLGLQWVAAPPMGDEPGLHDVTGTTARVELPAGLLGGAHRLRLNAGKMVHLELADAVPVAQSAVWWVKVGNGEVWVLAGTDLAENARLDLLDNIVPWARLAARGPVMIDEFHHLRASAAPTPVNIAPTLWQFAVLGLAFILVFAPRLGPPRLEPTRTHRAGLEYVHAMARLTAGARVDDEVIAALRTHARKLAHERLGVSPTLPWAEAARAITDRHPAAGHAFAELGAHSTFLDASRSVALFEHSLPGD